MAMLADQVDVVIGVDTHKHTNTAALVEAATSGVVEEMTVATDLEGHKALFEMAVAHGGFRLWAIEGTGSYGAGLTRFLRERGEWIGGLDPPNRTYPPGGKKTAAVRAGPPPPGAPAPPDLGEPPETARPS